MLLMRKFIYLLLLIVGTGCSLLPLSKDEFRLSNENSVINAINYSFVEIDNKENIYFTSKSTLYSWNQQNGFKTETDFQKNISGLQIDKVTNNLYIAEGKNIWLYASKKKTLVLEHAQFDVKTMFYDANNLITICSTPISLATWYIAPVSDFRKNYLGWRTKTDSLAYSFVNNRLFYIDNRNTPGRLCYVTIDNNTVTDEIRMQDRENDFKNPIDIFPDGLKIINPTGEIFNNDDNISYYGTIGEYKDVCFNNQAIIVLVDDLRDGQNYDSKLKIVSNEAPFVPLQQDILLEGRALQILSSQEKVFVLTYNNNKIYIYNFLNSTFTQ